MIVQDAAGRRSLLERSTTIAVVGASPNPLRPSYTVFSYLRTQTDFDVSPINPNASDIDGIKTYPTIAAYAQARGAPDIVDVFRKPSDLMPIVHDALAVGAKALWLQYGVIDADAIAFADRSGLAVVVDRCIKVEHARFHGGLSTNGFFSGTITSKRAALRRK